MEFTTLEGSETAKELGVSLGWYVAQVTMNNKGNFIGLSKEREICREVTKNFFAKKECLELAEFVRKKKYTSEYECIRVCEAVFAQEVNLGDLMFVDNFIKIYHETTNGLSNEEVASLIESQVLFHNGANWRQLALRKPLSSEEMCLFD